MLLDFTSNDRNKDQIFISISYSFVLLLFVVTLFTTSISLQRKLNMSNKVTKRKAAASDEEVPTSHVFATLVLGSYESNLFGVQLMSNNMQGLEMPHFRLSFAYQPHAASISCLASSGNILASGSHDESIKVYNIQKNKEIGALMHHTGTITALEFVGKHHLVSAGTDANIVIWRKSDWSYLGELTGHKSSVLALAPHPSGFLLLSLGSDKTIKLWHLVKGKCIADIKYHGIVSNIAWSSDGELYFLQEDQAISIYRTSGTLLCKIEADSKIYCASWFSDQSIIVGGESKKIQIYDVNSGNSISTFGNHEFRIKGISCLFSKESKYVVSVDSSGHIELWLVEDNKSPHFLTNFRLKNEPRITCLSIASAGESTSKKKQRKKK